MKAGTMRINIRTCLGAFGSLPYCAKLLLNFLKNRMYIDDIVVTNEYIPNRWNIIVDEAVSSAIYDRKADVAWVDTPGMLPLSYHKVDTDIWSKLYTTSEFNKQLLEELGFKVDGVIYRLIDDRLFYPLKEYVGTKYDIITIGKHCMCDRKNLRMQRDIILSKRIKSVIISDIWIPKRPWIKQYNFGTVPDALKARLLAESRFLLWTSFVEGFGMPVYEAMAIGTVPIYTDVPAHNEFAVGIPIKANGKAKGFCYGTRVIKWYIDRKEVEEAIDYALGMGKEEYEDLSEKCKEKAVEMYNETVDKIKLLLPGGGR